MVKARALVFLQTLTQRLIIPWGCREKHQRGQALCVSGALFMLAVESAFSGYGHPLPPYPGPPPDTAFAFFAHLREHSIGLKGVCLLLRHVG